jgi:hypothetical protein
MKADYSAAWHDFRRRRIISWVVLLGYPPGATAIFLVLGMPLATLAGIKPDYFFYAIALSWMAAFLVTSFRQAYFPCPKCGEPFFAMWWYRNPFARKCVHCGLPKWASSDDQISD